MSPKKRVGKRRVWVKHLHADSAERAQSVQRVLVNLGQMHAEHRRVLYVRSRLEKMQPVELMKFLNSPEAQSFGIIIPTSWVQKKSNSAMDLGRLAKLINDLNRREKILETAIKTGEKRIQKMQLPS